MILVTDGANIVFFSDKKFEDLELCNESKRALKEKLKFEYMTHIQAKAIPHLLRGRDLLGAAKTGSGIPDAYQAKL